MQQQPTDNRLPESRRIELGWLLARDLGKADREMVLAARRIVSEYLKNRFSRFEWRMPAVRRGAASSRQTIEPSRLLVEGNEERYIRHWDFALVVTRADLRSYYKPFAMAVPSRAISVAVVSIARLLQEETIEGELNSQRRREVTVQRLTALTMHLLGDLNGLPHSEEPKDFMYEPASADDLELMEDFSEEEIRFLSDELADVADERLEEHPAALRWGVPLFYLRAAWIGRGDIFSAILQAKPWEFPFRLSRLTTAAMSALFILLMTAEAWDLGMNHTIPFVAVMSIASLCGTSLYVLKHQNLFLHRARQHLTEQTVFTNISITLIILLGLTTTYLLLFGLTLAIGMLVYPPRLVQGWAVSLQHAVAWQDYCVMAGFVSSLGILIGALGATFEENHYFRHITFVDEET